MIRKTNLNEELEDFSLVVGGPLYQLYLRTRLSNRNLDLCFRRIIFFFIITWLPLLLLSFIEGNAYSQTHVTFFSNIDINVRFIFSLPLLILAEIFIHKHIRIVVKGFKERDIIALEDLPKFEGIVSSNLRLRNSVLIEIVLIISTFTIGHWIWETFSTLSLSTWYAAIKDGQPQLTLAGYWYIYISLPIFQFILLRWYFRVFIWYRFLWQVSRLPLNLNVLHPDRSGGLGFLVNSSFAMLPLLLAHTVLLAGMIGDHIWHEGKILTEYRIEIASFLVFLILLAFTPLFFFLTHLAQAKLIGLREYGIIASHYVNDFRHKWIYNLKGKEALLGTSDIQSLADLSNSYAVGNEMGLLPFRFKSVLLLATLVLIPLYPLLLTMMPLEEIVNSLVKVIL